MIAQRPAPSAQRPAPRRPAAAAPVLVSPVEALPLADNTVDAAMAILTLHHWESVEAGLTELLRVVRERIVLADHP